MRGANRLGIRVSASLSAAASIQVWSRVQMGCSMTMTGVCGAPSAAAVRCARRSKGVVTTVAEGTPSSEHRKASRKLHDVHAPQSPMPLTMTWALASMRVRSSSVIENAAVSFCIMK